VLRANFALDGTVKYEWKLLGGADFELERTSFRTDISRGLFVEGKTKIYGGLDAETIQLTTPRNSTLPLRKDGMTFYVETNAEGEETGIVFRYRNRNGVERKRTLTFD
jgi:hypothetical protein